MSAKTDRNKLLKQLEEVQLRSRRGQHTHNDYRTLVNTVITLVHKSYERDIQQEENDDLHDQVMSEMSWGDFQD